MYAAALASARAHAAELGYSPDNLRVTGASLSPRAWGEDWKFSFVLPREGAFKNSFAFSLSVRRTMVAETLVDAYGVEDIGHPSAFVGFRAADLPGFVKVDPMAVIAKSGDEARALSLQARWSGPEGKPELWYVVSGENGRELAAINASTGREEKPDRWAAARTIGLIAATFGLYALMYWAFTHAPAASSLLAPDQAPLPGSWDAGAMFGGMLGLTGLSGRAAGGKKAVSDGEIAAAARSVAASKGGVWSRTEYNMGYSNALESLKARGATDAQLERFKKLCDEAPVIGGRFNPWSGD